MEQRSIELSLEYRYMFVTDITNCYGSVNPQAFVGRSLLKTLSMRKTTRVRFLKASKNIFVLSNKDVILAFHKEVLYLTLLVKSYLDIQIFCYMKQYKRQVSQIHTKLFVIVMTIVFSATIRMCFEKISYILQHVLESLNFRMNSKKTKISDSIVTDAVKSDKLAYIHNTPIFNKKGCDFDSFEKHLLYILMFARQYPDSGSIKTMLSDIDKRMEDWLKPYEEEVTTIPLVEGGEPTTEKITKQRRLVGGSVRAMSAVCTQIALENVGCCHYALRVLSRMVDSLKDKNEKSAIISLVYSKLCNQPNSDYNQLWLQNMTYQQDKKNGTSPYSLRLCQLVAGKEIEPLWNNEWLKTELTTNIRYDSVVNGDTLKKVTPVITFRERRAYDSQYYLPTEEDIRDAVTIATF